jgi:hypothetical protein
MIADTIMIGKITIFLLWSDKCNNIFCYICFISLSYYNKWLRWCMSNTYWKPAFVRLDWGLPLMMISNWAIAAWGDTKIWTEISVKSKRITVIGRINIELFFVSNNVWSFPHPRLFINFNLCIYTFIQSLGDIRYYKWLRIRWD